MKCSVKDPTFPLVKLDDGTTVSAFKLDIMLDGIVQKNVTAFDTEEGWVQRHMMASDGSGRGRRRIHIKDGAIIEETVTGKVSIRVKP